MNKYNKILSGVESSSTLSEDFSAVKAGVRKIKARRRRARFAGIAAAAALTTSVTAAGAAYNWDIRAITAAWFGGRTEHIAESTVEITADNVTGSFDSLTVEPIGAVYDENIAVIFVEFTRTDGGIFDCTPYEALTSDGEPYPEGSGFTESPQYKFSEFDMYIPAGGEWIFERRFLARCYFVNDGNPADNKITAAFCMDSRSLNDENRKVHIEFGSLREEKYTFRKIGEISATSEPLYSIEAHTVETINGSWSGDIDFGEIRPTDMKKITPNSNTEMRVSYRNGSITEHEFTVTELSVSQISVNAKLHSENPDEMMCLVEFGVGEMTMRDGRTIPICPDFRTPYFIAESGNLTGLNVPQDDSWEVNATFMLQESIDPDDVKAIRLGSTVFDME